MTFREPPFLAHWTGSVLFIQVLSQFVNHAVIIEYFILACSKKITIAIASMICLCFINVLGFYLRFIDTITMAKVGIDFF